MMMWMIASLAISLGLLKQSSSLKTKQCNGQQLCICGKSQTAGLDRTGMDGCMNEGAWRWRVGGSSSIGRLMRGGIVYIKYHELSLCNSVCGLKIHTWIHRLMLMIFPRCLLHDYVWIMMPALIKRIKSQIPQGKLPFININNNTKVSHNIKLT